MKHSLFWAAVEAGSKAARTGGLTGYHAACSAARSGLSVVGALVDCGIPRQHAGAQWLAAFEEENESLEQGTCLECGLAQFARGERVSSDWLFKEEANGAIHLHAKPKPETPVVSATAPVEDLPGGVPPTPPGTDSELTHLAQCLRDAVGDHYDFACRPYDQFPFWHDDHLIDAFDWEGATNAFLEDVRRAYDPQHPQYDEELQK